MPRNTNTSIMNKQPDNLTNCIRQNRRLITWLGLFFLFCLSLFIQNLRCLRNKQKAKTSVITTRPLTTPDNHGRQPSIILPTARSHPPQQQLSPVQTQILVSTPRDRVKRFLRTEMPYPVEGRDINLYLLWKPATSAMNTTYTLPQGFESRQTSVSSWIVTEIFQKPLAASTHSSWLSAENVAEIIKKLAVLLQEIAATAASQPAYVIFDIQELCTQKPRFTFFYSREKKRRIDQYATDRQKAVVENLQSILRTALPTVNDGQRPKAFDHYDRNARRRGWLTISPTWALFANVEEGQVRTLANLIQPRDCVSQQGGLASDRYEEVLVRIMLWNGTQDLFEAVNRIEDVAEGGTISTKGQLWLNFALASIGALLAFFSLANIGITLAWPLLLLVGASLLHALYALKGNRFLYYVGILLFVTAIITSLIVFAPFWMPILFPVEHVPHNIPHTPIPQKR